MTESEFWTKLEYRLCAELAGLEDRRHRHFWCDGLIPLNYVLEGEAPRITGRAWICNGDQQAEWEFTLLLPHSHSSQHAIAWESLVPPDDLTGWMTFNEEAKEIEIDPREAQ